MTVEPLSVRSKKHCRSQAKTSRATASYRCKNALKYPFRKSKANTLLANLERLKSTLTLVLKVISYAKKVDSQ
jgi:hypothetical protein